MQAATTAAESSGGCWLNLVRRLCFTAGSPTPSWAAIGNCWLQGRVNMLPGCDLWLLMLLGLAKAPAAALIRLSGLRIDAWMGGAHGRDFWEELRGENGTGGHNQISLCTHTNIRNSEELYLKYLSSHKCPECSHQYLSPHYLPALKNSTLTAITLPQDLAAITETECGFSDFQEWRTCCGHWLLSYSLAWKWGACYLTPQAFLIRGSVWSARHSVEWQESLVSCVPFSQLFLACHCINIVADSGKSLNSCPFGVSFCCCFI